MARSWHDTVVKVVETEFGEEGRERSTGDR
jgi:hypothetical protein